MSFLFTTAGSFFLPAGTNEKVTMTHSVFPFEVLPQMTSCAERAGLHGRDRQTETSSGFRSREVLQFAECNHGSQALPKTRCRLNYQGAKLLFGESLFWRRALIGYFQL
jgi:hypothetical protein